jgi:hypothetical protein
MAQEQWMQLLQEAATRKKSEQASGRPSGQEPTQTQQGGPFTWEFKMKGQGPASPPAPPMAAGQPGMAPQPMGAPQPMQGQAQMDPERRRSAATGLASLLQARGARRPLGPTLQQAPVDPNAQYRALHQMAMQPQGQGMPQQAALDALTRRG